jgi:Flp pilus assembly secretin CpaC
MFTQWDDDRKIVSRKKEPFKRKKRVMKITFKETAEPGTKFLQDVEPGQTFVYNSFVYQKARVNERALLINNISSNQNVVQQLVIEIRTGLITTMAHNVPVRLVEAEVVVHRFI